MILARGITESYNSISPHSESTKQQTNGSVIKLFTHGVTLKPNEVFLAFL